MSAELSPPADPPLHPGAVLRNRVLAGTAAATSGTAARLPRLAGLCGISAHVRLGLQLAHDLWHTQRALADTLARIPAHALPDTLKTDFMARHARTL